MSSNGGQAANSTSASNGQTGSNSASGSSGQGGTRGTSSAADGSEAAAGDGAGSGGAASSAHGASGSVSATGGANANGQDQVTVSLVRNATAADDGQVTVSVPEEVVSSGKPFSFALPSGATDGATKAKVRVTLVNGKRLPTWLKYIPVTHTFVATAMPGGALPLDVLVTVGARKTVVTIIERKAH
jgi:hypothetical protein